MKITGLFCLLFALYQTVVGKAIQADTTKLAKEKNCVNELQLDENEIKRINSLDIVPEYNENFNKFLSCYWKKMDWVNDDETINYENLQKALIDAAISEIDTDDYNDQVKLMVRLLTQATIVECKTKTDGGNSIAKFQNCIIHEMENAMNSK